MDPNSESTWFGQIRYSGGLRTTPATFGQLQDLLARLQPAALDTVNSSVELGPDGLSASLVHGSRRIANIDFGCSTTTGGLMSLVGYEEYYGDYGEDGPLSKVMLEDLARLLASDYHVNEAWWKGRMVQRVVRGPHMSGDGEIESHQGWLLAPTRLIGERRLDRREYTVTFNCQAS